MSIHESTESAAAEADRRAQRAKASLLSRFDELKHKLGDARSNLGVRQQIAQHPLPAVAIAFALGALAGSRREGPAVPERRGRSLGGAAMWALGALGLRILREIALGQLGDMARQWWLERYGEPAREPSMTGARGPGFREP